ncbi:MAG: cob(I)yrinic acid a,c-diamide adenosyltransferase [Candidatus Palauibacterales bacterium]|nr:cob(I)yrinic acid a,c-diamide adenosyltransferase [Candidatus Palauibacterales bacterium]MDP2528545.1 cob(I)yrinic acid a,c-diamide adenosyltransferase [Candidatus Palauibacterales bacterium]MDP2584775.1 cob(I)yrinic acid a,c-diamide adenosyltransferase [Candidatus Palauibacterales bacterium]
MKIYTRGGDEGETGLLGGTRVSKTDPRVEAYGTIDELNTSLGLALALDHGGVLDADAEELRGVQGDLLTVGAGLAAAHPDRERERGTVPRLPEDRVAEIEAWIDRLASELPELDAFLLPGGCPAGAQLHVARTVCRRAERAAVRLANQRPGAAGDPVSETLPYLNRLSDLLFMLARAANHRAGSPEAEWTPVRRRESGRSPTP